MTDITQIPGSIVKAVCAVQTTVDAVRKSQKNTHGGYMFASTDDIYAAVTQKMGKIGLLCLCLEGEAEIQRHKNKEGREVPWLRAIYHFVLATEDATWTDPKSRRTVLAQITGPQTFQAAQSYAEKSYLRSLFKIPTGDMDLDSLPDGYEYNPIFGVTPPAPPEPPAAKAKAVDQSPPEFNIQAFMVNLEDELCACQDTEALGECWAHSELVMEDHLDRNQREEALDIYRKHEERLSKPASDMKAAVSA